MGFELSIMDSDKLILLAIVIIVAIFFIFIFAVKHRANEETGDIVVLNVTQYLNDGYFLKNDTTHEIYLDYLSAEPGDVIVIRDRIVQPPKYRRDPILNITATTLTICSPGKYSWPIVIYVDGNVTDKYKLGDLVEIKIHIKYYDFHQERNGEIWHIYGEFPEESMLNGKYTGGVIIVPPTQVKKIKE